MISRFLVGASCMGVFLLAQWAFNGPSPAGLQASTVLPLPEQWRAWEQAMAEQTAAIQRQAQLLDQRAGLIRQQTTDIETRMNDLAWRHWNRQQKDSQ